MAHRTFNQSQRPASRRSADISGTSTRSRPPAKLRTIEETAELFNTSTRTVRRLIDAGALPVAPPGTLRSHFGSGYRGIPRRESQHLV